MAIKIRRLSTSGGYLEAAPIEFCGALTCIIGARGTCKSTIVETIRFVFDCDRSRIQRMTATLPAADVEPESHQGLLAATLGAATARCEIVDASTDEQNLSLERDIGSQPRLYRDGVKQLTDQQVLQCVEIYSQGELQRIAEEPLRRLELIDKPNHRRISALKHERDQKMKKLREVGNRCVTPTELP